MDFEIARFPLFVQSLGFVATGLVNGFAVNSWGGIVGSLAYLAINFRTVRQLQRSTFKPKA